jgi:DNA-directed RNA polymerase subunit H (RpoH/RPB5)
MAGEIDVLGHELVPKHEVLTEEEKKEVLERYKVSEFQLPKILASDPAARVIGAKVGDVIKITRESLTAGKTIAYRLVVEG